MCFSGNIVNPKTVTFLCPPCIRCNKMHILLISHAKWAAGDALMLSLGPIGRRLPSQSCQRPVLELVRNVWRGARSPCSSLQSGRGSFRAWSTSRGLILRAKFEQPSRTLCSLVGKNSRVCPRLVITRVSTALKLL